MSAVPSVSYSITVRLEVPAGGGSVSQLTTATLLRLMVSRRASSGFFAMARQTLATPGV